jgi:hypothetical protein
MRTRTPQDQRRQQQKSRRSTGSPRAGSEGDGKLATGGRLGLPAEIRGDTGATFPYASRTREQTAPNPGTSRGGALGEDGGQASARTANGRDRSGKVNTWTTAKGMPRRMPKGGARPAAEDAVRGGEEGGEHGHELKIRHLAVLRARAWAGVASRCRE